MTRGMHVNAVAAPSIGEGARSASLAPANARLAEGMLFADVYEIGALLGGGATSNVYLARQVRDGEQVALKVIHPHLVGNRQVSARFMRETSVLRRLYGAHIVGVRDFGEDANGLLYLALEPIHGPSLSELMRDRPELPTPLVVSIMLAILDALETAHRANIIHRDLKPDNVIVRVRGDVLEQLHVLDFGLAKVLRGGGPGSTNLTGQNMVLGTPAYMAPEQARGDDLDARCDVYAAGIILFELLTGAVPFTGRSAMAIITGHLTVTPAPVTVRPSGEPVGAALAAVVAHAIAKSPAQRYDSAATLARAIRQALAAPENVAAVQPSPSQRDNVPFRDADSSNLALADAMLSPGVGAEQGLHPLSVAPGRASRVPIWLPVALLAGIAGVAIGVLIALAW